MKSLLSIFVCLWAVSLAAQPVINSKQWQDGFDIYRDYQDPGQFYYGPGSLKLAEEDEGKPSFQLTQMRYTGTACAGDQGDKRFLNLAQFTLEMDRADPAALARLKTKLKNQYRNPRLKLSPLPIRFLQTHVLLPVSSNGRHQRSESEGISEGNGGEGAFWEKKSFTFRLTHVEAQLLWRQVEDNHMIISVGYGFYADAVLGEDGEMTLSGGKEEVEEMLKGADWEELLRGDTTLMPRLMDAGTLTFDLDVSAYPGLLKQLDINEGLPPDYPALELRCYDFRDELRPDLALKRIEIAATGINGRPLAPQSVQFTKRNPQQYLQNFRFPFAVRMEEEMQYRITSYTLKGERSATDWISRPICEGLVDLTTTAEDNPLEKVEVAFEIEPTTFDSTSFESVDVLLGFEFGGSLHLQKIQLSKNEGSAYKEFTFRRDKNGRSVFALIWKDKDGKMISQDAQTLEENYYFLSPPGSR